MKSKAFLITALLTLASSQAFAQSGAAAPESSPSSGQQYPSSNIKQAGRFGLGLEFGTGAWPASIKYFAADSFSIQATGPFWGIWLGFGLGLSTDFLFEGKPFFKQKAFELSWQAGLGTDTFWYQHTYRYYNDVDETNSHFILGLHANVGIQMLFTRYPIDLVLEFRPGFYASNWNREYVVEAHGTTVRAKKKWGVYHNIPEFALHARYYF